MAGMEYLFETGWAPRPETTAAALEDEIRCDIAVIGGLGGMAAGLRLAERGADVVVLEAGVCGWGSSSRNGGHLSDALGGDPRLLAALHPRRLPDIIRLCRIGHGIHR
ncbi:FAD-dependent oxidoreductase [Mycobacterium syngnathidarum]